ncbi:MAG: phosphate ABC transporter permease PstA [Anaerolineae bacterium]|nr:phosphate ABC transporter permease PstA [Thermoflexales bacterium]MDW8406334.1 phosphate ABC transporter permease PstA [Anaerolineae bacterium]
MVSNTPAQAGAPTSAHLQADRAIRNRLRTAASGRIVLFLSLVLALLVLIALILNVVDQLGGYVVYGYRIDPKTVLPARTPEEMSEQELRELILNHTPQYRLEAIPDDYGLTLDEMDKDQLVEVVYAEIPDLDPLLAARPLSDLSNQELVVIIEQNITTARFAQLSEEKPLDQRTRQELLDLFETEVLEERVVNSWRLFDSLLNGAAIVEKINREYPGKQYELRWWLTSQFVTSPQTTRAETTGLRTAILGSVLIVIITILFSMPIGIAAGVYLEEFAAPNRINQFLQANIYNLSGVPTIIYGLMGLAIFVRALGDLTNGSMFGVPNPPPNGRTIISAGLTMGLLVMPLIIINTQEAIRAVPQSIRDGALAVGATYWQTVWYHVLPMAVPGILTGVILAISRAVGETAPLVVVGAATYISVDPSGLFSGFTAIPIQIWSWTALPEQTFRNVAAAAIIILLSVVILFNLTAIILRNRLRKSL